MNLLALDLGTSYGYAIYIDGTIISGTKKLRVDKKASGSRFLDFRNWLIQVIKKYCINKVFFERVYGHTGMEAAHIYGGFIYMLAAVCLELNVECTGLAVKSIKKFMAGTGNASKDQMIAAARSQGFDPADDNEADALGVLFLGLNRINESYDTLSLRVLPSPGRERVPSPRLFASGRTFSEDDRQAAGGNDYVSLAVGRTCLQGLSASVKAIV